MRNYEGRRDFYLSHCNLIYYKYLQVNFRWSKSHLSEGSYVSFFFSKITNIFSYLNLVNKRVDTDFQTALRFLFSRGNIFFFPLEGRTELKRKLSPVQLFSTQLRMRMVLNGSRRCSKPLEPIQQTVSSAFCESQVSGCLER